MNAQIIEQDGKPAFAVMPFPQSQALLARQEDRDHVADAMAARDAESLPAALVNQLLDGSEHPLRVWRKHRKLTLAQLAGQVGARGKRYPCGKTATAGIGRVNGAAGEYRSQLVCWCKSRCSGQLDQGLSSLQCLFELR